MAASVADMANTPITVQIAGKEVALTAITPGDLGKIERWVKDFPLREFKNQIAQIGEVLTKEERRELWERMLEETEKYKVLSDDEPQKLMQSFDGITYVLWLLAQHTDPTITYEDAMHAVAFNQEEVALKLNELNSLPPSDDEDEEGDDGDGKKSLGVNSTGAASTSASRPTAASLPKK